MAKNIEIKAKLNNLNFSLNLASNLSGSKPEIIKQDDYFFHCDNGRLKLRIFSPDNGELIFYTRDNLSGPKISEYFITKTTEPYILLKVLKKSNGIRGKISMIRKLFLVGRTRIHIDIVENLGNFLEFEVVLKEDENPEIGNEEINRLMNQFKINKENLIDRAYIDLI